MMSLHNPLRARLIRTLVFTSLLTLLLATAALAQSRDELLSDMAGFTVELTARTMATVKVMPAYPEEAVAKGVKGVVMVRIGVDGDGKVGKVKVPPGLNPLLRKAVVVAARQWRYEPTPHFRMKPGTYMTYRLTFQFVIADGKARAGLHPDWRYGPDDGVFPVVAREWTTWEDATDDY